MTVEVKVEETQMGGEEVVIPTQEEEPKTVDKCSSFKEESNFLPDLKEFERKALNDLKSILDEAILGNTLFNKPPPLNLKRRRQRNQSKKKKKKKRKQKQRK